MHRTKEKTFKHLIKRKRISIENEDVMYELINTLIKKLDFHVFSIDKHGISMSKTKDYKKSKSFRYSFDYHIHFHYGYHDFLDLTYPCCSYSSDLYRYPNSIKEDDY